MYFCMKVTQVGDNGQGFLKNGFGLNSKEQIRPPNANAMKLVSYPKIESPNTNGDQSKPIEHSALNHMTSGAALRERHAKSKPRRRSEGTLGMVVLSFHLVPV